MLVEGDSPISPCLFRVTVLLPVGTVTHTYVVNREEYNRAFGCRSKMLAQNGTLVNGTKD